MSAFQLSGDLIHEIFLHVSDCTTLSAAILLSKAHYEVFQSHPRSILRAVIENAIGPAMPQAARLAWYQQQQRDQWDTPLLEALPDEEHFLGLDWTITRDLVESLERNAKAISILRNFYSMRFKDRTYSTSKLGSEEVLRFDRALYRYWLWLEMLRSGALWQSAEEEDIDDDGWQEERLLPEFTNTIEGLSTDELLEVLNVGVFCENTARWEGQALYGPHGMAHAGFFFPMHPGGIARCMERGDFLQVESCRPWTPIYDFIQGLLRSRKVKAEEMDQKIPSAIVTSVVGAGDRCSRCDSVGGLELLGTGNMSLLAGLLPVREKLATLPGFLNRNLEECRQIKLFIFDSQDRIPERDIFQELVDIVPGPEYTQEHWSKDSWYCLGCIRELFKQRFMLWWRQTKEKNGTTAQEDCWYGYNCRTMTHRPNHASKLNHLCIPTRGDAPNVPQPINAPN